MNLANSPNFSGYPFRSEMEADGIENAVKAIPKFDPDKSNNPFGYFTRVIYFAFLRRIKKEKKNLYLIYKLYEKASIAGMLADTNDHDTMSTITMMRDGYMEDFIQKYEDSMEVEKQKKKDSKLKKEEENDEKASSSGSDNPDGQQGS